MDSFPRSNKPGHYGGGEYQASIELENARREILNLYCLEQPTLTEPSILHFNEPFKLRVRYECLLPEVPDVPLGVKLDERALTELYFAMKQASD